MIPAAEYHRIVVLPCLDAFDADKGDLRLAMQAATSLTHAIDYVYQNRGPDPATAGARAEAYRRDLAERCFSFGVVEGFAMASESGTLDRGDLRGLSSRWRDAFTPAAFGLFTFESASLGGGDAGIRVDRKHHGWVDLAGALRVSRSMMETELPELLEPPRAPAPANLP